MIDYKKFKDKIIVYNTKDFNIVQSLDCGQIFRYNINDNIAIVYSKDKKAICETCEDRVEIKTLDVDYFEDFFDLKTNYANIKNQLKPKLS
jgi:chloramphenicol O-acetyltransferase